MADLIERKKVLEILGIIGHGRPISGKRAISLIREMPGASMWIPCSERLPEDNAEVLVSFCGRYVKIGYIEPGDGLRYWVIPGHSVVHLDYIEAWMPLPEPPESEVQRNE